MSSYPMLFIPGANLDIVEISALPTTEKELQELLDTFVGEMATPLTLAKVARKINEYLSDIISKEGVLYAYSGVEIIQIIPYLHNKDSIVLNYITKETRTGKILKPDEVALGFYEGKWLYFGYTGGYAEEETSDGVVVYTSADECAKEVIAEARKRAVALGAWIKYELHG